MRDTRPPDNPNSPGWIWVREKEYLRRVECAEESIADGGRLNPDFVEMISREVKAGGRTLFGLSEELLNTLRSKAPDIFGKARVDVFHEDERIIAINPLNRPIRIIRDW